MQAWLGSRDTVLAVGNAASKAHSDGGSHTRLRLLVPADRHALIQV